MDKNNLGIVIIGRNEGERLPRCIKSAIRETDVVVYVDSGSTDSSIELARQLGAEVISLDLSVPFTAARARNAGFEFLNAQYPSLNYVQFIDGDCELVEGWIQQSLDFLSANPQFAVACGRRRERFPNASIYNLLCDLEWDTPVGETKSCGGDALMRVDALQAVNGFNGSLIAGEEPELCIRLRQAGWKIYRLDVEMTLHDVAMTRLWQWWKRSQRAGYAFAEGAYLHGMSPEKYRLKETISIFIWGGIVPILLFILSIINQWFLLGWLVYLLQIIKVAIKKHKLISKRLSLFYASFVMLAKFPQFNGIIDFILSRKTNKVHEIIEYK
ncbi:glycosyltransferase [Methylobacter luteus]|uniref:glycosyltransferase n=1 Tax=Methylobacter luteus TaxID=415 RepID=UPI0003F4BF24|nr:glycosyltransferase [Methylobacter luteus]